MCSGLSDGLAHGFSLMRTKVVEDHDISRTQGGHEELLYIGQKARAIDRSVEQARRGDTVVTQGGQEGGSLPMAVRDLGNKPLAARRPAMGAGHVGLGPGLVDEHQPGRIDTVLVFAPLGAAALYVRAVLLGGVERLFFTVMPMRRKNRLIMPVSAFTPRSVASRSHSAWSVMSG